MKYFKLFFVNALIALLATGCIDHVPEEEDLPSPAVSFIYEIVDDLYQLDYYVGAEIEFTSTSAAQGECSWDFGDNTSAVGAVVRHKYTAAGAYNVRLTVAGAGSLAQVIAICDIKPILIVNPVEGGICEVLTTPVDFTVILPNPDNLPTVYTWTFPNGTEDENGTPLTTFTGENPGKVKFGNVGSQNVRLSVEMGGRVLEEGSTNVQVAYNQPVLTLYYAVKKGNLMALKLPQSPPEGMQISPFDLGVSSGQHALNILFADSLLYMLDCGLQFTFVDDVDSVLGDGKISVVSKDGKRVETMLSNAGGAAFNDPFYGYIEGQTLYFANRNTGIATIGLDERNRAYSLESFPWFVQNDRLGYYKKGYDYGAMNAGFGKINGVWYWCKTYNGTGIFRFTNSDILAAAQSGNDDPPAAGIAIPGTYPKSFVWDAANNVIYFALYDEGGKYGGLYRCTLAELDQIGTVTSNLLPYRLTLANGKSVAPTVTAGKGEGSSGEYIGICQLALDPTDGSVYFGFRSTDAATSSGLMRYNPASGYIEYVLEGVDVYGVALNLQPSKLF
ncbi:MAG: PKD domain-containing protein [Prevotellaceae bacterium]|jgi:PKD repeat protein|nr:PKD domain-containing protein [Prevotellaceae bacterium]